MNQHTQQRTVAALLAFMAMFAVNTTFAIAMDEYSTWFSWVVVTIAIAMLAVALGLQARLNRLQIVALQLVPLVVAVVGAVFQI